MDLKQAEKAHWLQKRLYQFKGQLSSLRNAVENSRKKCRLESYYYQIVFLSNGQTGGGMSTNYSFSNLELDMDKMVDTTLNEAIRQTEEQIINIEKEIASL